MEQFTIVEFSVFCIGIISACGGLLTIIQHSKCEKIRACGCECDRPKEAIMSDVTRQIAEAQP